MTNCKICKNEFIGRNSSQKCCSSKCSKINYKHYQLSYHKTNKYINYQKKYDNSENRKISQIRVNNSIKRKKYLSLFRSSVVWKNIKKKYEKSPKGQIYLFNKWRRRRAIKNNILELFTSNEWFQMKEATKGICPCCKKDVGLSQITLDHIYSIYHANKDFLNTGNKRKYTIFDIQPLCSGCNSKKCNKIINIEPKGLNSN